MVEALVVVVVVTSYYRTNLPTKINPKRFTEEKSAQLFKHSIGSRDPLLLLKTRIDCVKAAPNAKAPPPRGIFPFTLKTKLLCPLI